MRFDVITLFPEMIETTVRFGVVGQAIKQGILEVSALSPRAFTSNTHQTIDDRPFGGGDGMIMMAEPLAQAIRSIKARPLRESQTLQPLVIHLSPRGKPLSDKLVRDLANGGRDLILIASRYGGVDQRLLNQEVDLEISIGDYILSGGELPALAVIDAVGRVLPGVLGNEKSSEDESFRSGRQALLEYPQFTRPREWEGHAVPEILLSGDHAKIEKYKSALALAVTVERRADLLGLNKEEKPIELAGDELTSKSIKSSLELLKGLSARDRAECGIGKDLEDLTQRLKKLLECCQQADSTRGRS